MWIFQFPCPLGFAIILQGSGSAQGRVQLGVAPPGMIYITILSLLAPLVTAGVKGFGIIFSVSWDRETEKKRRVGFDPGKTIRGPPKRNQCQGGETSRILDFQPYLGKWWNSSLNIFFGLKWTNQKEKGSEWTCHRLNTFSLETTKKTSPV